MTGSLLIFISFDGDDGDVIEVRALTFLLAQREVRALSCALSLSLRTRALTCTSLLHNTK